MSENKKEFELVMKKSDGFFVKNRVVLHYNNIGTAFITLYHYKNDKLVKEETHSFESYEIKDGLPVNINKVADIIKNFAPKIDSLQLLVSSDEVFKSTISLPKISKSKAKKLYKCEIKDEIKEHKNDYISYFECYTHSLGYIFYTYFLPISIINTFIKVAALVKVKLTKVDLFARYLLNLAKNIEEEDFVIHYEEDGLTTFVLSYDNVFSSFSSFSSEEESLNLNYLITVVKHSFELEKKDVNVIYSNNVDKVKSLNETIELDLNFKNYNFKGLDL